MIVKRFGCTAIHNKALYKCIIHSFIQYNLAVSTLGERLTLELALDTKRGPEGPSIVQGSPAEGQGVKLIKVDPALSNRP